MQQLKDKTVRIELGVVIILLAAGVLVGGAFLLNDSDEGASSEFTQEEIDLLREELREARIEEGEKASVENWEVYSDTELGVSFQYPATWTLVKQENEAEGTVRVIAKRDENTRFIYHSGSYQGVGFADEETVFVDGRQLTKFTRERDIHIPVSDNQLLVFESDKLSTYEPVFEKILSTMDL